jgi:hypothetical protein
MGSIKFREINVDGHFALETHAEENAAAIREVVGK